MTTEESLATQVEDVRRRIQLPANCLVAASLISLLGLLLTLTLSIGLLVSGAVDRLEDPSGMSKETQIGIRIAWNLMMQGVSVVILIGALKMRKLASLTWARLACFLALVPCVGPCFLLGIPFGIWGLVVINNPATVEAFSGLEKAGAGA